MRWGSIFIATLVVIAIFLFQWPKFNSNQKKEKWVFILLSGFAWCLFNFLLIYPDFPSPTEFINFMYKPLGKLLD